MYPLSRTKLLKRRCCNTPDQSTQLLGGAKVIRATAADRKSMSDLVGGLGPGGRMIVAGAPGKPLEGSPLALFVGSRIVEGTPCWCVD